MTRELLKERLGVPFGKQTKKRQLHGDLSLQKSHFQRNPATWRVPSYFLCMCDTKGKSDLLWLSGRLDSDWVRHRGQPGPHPSCPENSVCGPPFSYLKDGGSGRSGLDNFSVLFKL